MSSFVRNLIDRGHEVTYLTGNSLKHLNLTNYTEILIEPSIEESHSKTTILKLLSKFRFYKENINFFFI